MEMLLIPTPAVKNEMTKSSKDILKAMSAPEMIAGRICGMMTFVSACHGVAPRSRAASATLSSSCRSFGMIDRIT